MLNIKMKRGDTTVFDLRNIDSPCCLVSGMRQYIQCAEAFDEPSTTHMMYANITLKYRCDCGDGNTLHVELGYNEPWVTGERE